VEWLAHPPAGIGFRPAVGQKVCMIPAPNIIAGLLIGFTASDWPVVVLGAGIWPFLFCCYVFIFQAERKEAVLDDFRMHGRPAILNSPSLSFFIAEFYTALMTSFIIGMMGCLVKTLLN
jgi:hypothetical protein